MSCGALRYTCHKCRMQSQRPSMEPTLDFSRRFTTGHAVPYTTELSLMLVSLAVIIGSAPSHALRLSWRHSVNQLYDINILKTFKHYLLLNGPSPTDPLHRCANLHRQTFLAIEFRRTTLAITRNDISALSLQNVNTGLQLLQAWLWLLGSYIKHKLHHWV